MTKITGDESATGYGIPGDQKAGWLPEGVPGMTIQLRIAMAAMQGMLSGYDILERAFLKPKDVAEQSLAYANALIDEVNADSSVLEKLHSHCDDLERYIKELRLENEQLKYGDN